MPRRPPGFDLPPPVQGGASRQLSVLNGLEALADDASRLGRHPRCRPSLRSAPTTLRLPRRSRGRRHRRRDTGHCARRHAEARCHGRRHFRDGAARQSVAGADASGLPLRPAAPAHRAAASLGADEATALTDDAAVAERAGLRVVMVAGSDDNREDHHGRGHAARVDDGNTHGVRLRRAWLCARQRRHAGRHCRSTYSRTQRPFRCGCRATCVDRCDPGHHRRRRYRQALPAIGSTMARCLIRSIPPSRRRASASSVAAGSFISISR